MKHLVLSLMLIVVLLLSPSLGSAQGFNKGSLLIGPHIGLSAIGSTLSFGANIEAGITDPGKAGPGIIGISGRIDYWSWSFDSYYKYTWITVGVFGNYHFALEDRRWDLFVGLGIGYENVSSSYSGASSIFSYAYGSGIFFAANAGARYFFSQALALRALVGFGLTTFVLGIDFGL